jgi:hypothetical protein
MKGVTPQNSLEGKIQSFKQTMTVNGLISIFRAGWVKTTDRTQNRRQYILVCPYKNQVDDKYLLDIWSKILCIEEKA